MSANAYLVVALEEVVQIVPFTDRVAGRVQSMAAVLLEIVFPSGHQPPHTLHMQAFMSVTAI